MPPAIETRNLTKKFGSLHAVEGLTLSIDPGEIFGFLGPNGAGKTTTIRMMLGLVRPTAGAVLIHGRDVRRESPRSLDGVGSLVESPALYPYLSGADNLGVLGRALGRAGRERIRAVLDLVGLSEVAGKKVLTYSRGQRQRLGFALSLIGGSRVLILDEPSSGLDPPGRDDLRRILGDLSSKDGVTVFLSSHLLGEVEATCHRVGLLHEGRLAAMGSLEELLEPTAWRLRVRSGGALDAKEVAVSAPWCDEATVVDGFLEVAIEREHAADLCAYLVERGVGVEEFAPLRPTLEEFFRKHATRGRQG